LPNKQRIEFKLCLNIAVLPHVFGAIHTAPLHNVQFLAVKHLV